MLSPGMLPHKTKRGQAALERLKVFDGIPPPYDKVINPWLEKQKTEGNIFTTPTYFDPAVCDVTFSSLHTLFE